MVGFLRLKTKSQKESSQCWLSHAYSHWFPYMLIITRAPTTLALHHLCTLFSQKWSHVFQSWLRGRLPWMPIYRSGTETTAESQRDM